MLSHRIQALVVDAGAGAAAVENLGSAVIAVAADTIVFGINISEPCPPKFTINLSGQNIGDAGAIKIAEILKTGWGSADLVINLGNNNIGNEGMKALAEALKSGKCKQGLQLNLNGNQINAIGTTALAKALESGNCPQRLTINLASNSLYPNRLGNAAMEPLVEALTNPKCPPGLTLDLRDNSMNNEAVAPLIEAIKQGRVPKGLKVLLGRGIPEFEKDYEKEVARQLKLHNDKDIKSAAVESAFFERIRMQKLTGAESLVRQFLAPISLTAAQETPFFKKVITKAAAPVRYPACMNHNGPHHRGLKRKFG